MKRNLDARLSRLEAQRPRIAEPYEPPMPPEAWWQELESILRETGNWEVVLQSLGYSEEVIAYATFTEPDSDLGSGTS